MANERNWGGKRVGAGRKPTSATGDPFVAKLKRLTGRRNRIAVMLTDKELKLLQHRAAMFRRPVSTTAYEIIARSLSATT